MSKQEDEIRRLQRLRDEQLQARDPTAKERAQQQRLVARHHKTRKKITAKSVIQDFPAKWQFMVIGALIGLTVALIINIMFQAQWAQIVGGVLVLFGLVAGRVMGAVKDWGKEDWGRKY
jgi:predicted histidine transporter YuiF (NhaC family)